MPKQRVTYVTYNEGVEAKHFHLGNLVHDYKNPKAHEPYIETAYTDIEEPAPAWVHSTPLAHFALTLGKDSAKDDDDDSDDEDEQRYRVVAAAKATKLDIKEPKKFFNEVTLKSNDAKKWLISHISAAENLSPHPRPQIWMLTGLVLMTHATWTSLSSKQSFTAGLPAPFDPTGVSAIRRSSVSEHVRPVFGLEVKDDEKHIPGAVIHETGKFPGTRGWAAQWERVDVKILSDKKWQGGVDNQLMLKHKKGGSSNIALVELQDQVYAQNVDEDDESDEDEEYWEAFLDAAEEFV